MNKHLFTIAIGATLVALTPMPTFAAGDTVCQPTYGGGQTCVTTSNIIIDKKVANPSTGAFVDNLSVSDPKYGANQNVTFQITVTNNGGQAVQKLTVTDTLPQYVTVNSDSKLSFEAFDLKPNESKTFTVTGKLASTLPQDTTCLINQAKVNADGKEAQDNAQFCIQKGAPAPVAPQVEVTKGGKEVFPAPVVTTTPPTGPEALGLLALIPSGALGAFLRKKAH